MTVLGHWFVLVALVTAAGSALAYALLALNRIGSPAGARVLLHLSTIAVVFSSVVLVLQLLQHDYSNGYVYSYSDRSLPLHYLLSSFYAGQEGSFLFWSLCLTVFALFLWRTTSKRGNEPWVMAVFMTVTFGMLLLVAIKSPFRSLWEMFPQAPAGKIPSDGRGLNPLLQNFWMVIHPPVLFLGFAAMGVPFAFGVAGLWKKEYSILCMQALPWLLSAVAILGLGIMLGGYWAYGVLGWGGYWGWDPVENSSLIPWLTSIALVHTSLAQLRTSKYVRTNFILAIASFFFVMYSTFLTRSGILGDASVHSFTDPGAGVYWLLLVVLALIVVVGVSLLAVRWKGMKPEESARAFLTRETALGAGALALVLSALVVLFGTTLPIFSTTRVEPSFYDTTNLPIAVAMVVLIGFSLHMQWEAADGGETLRRSWKTLLISLLLTAILVVGGVRDAMMMVFSFASIFALAVNVEMGYRIVRGDPRFLGGKIAHIGLAFFFLGVISTGKYSTKDKLELPLNEPQQVQGYTLTYTGQKILPDGKSAYLVSAQQNGRRFDLAPVMYQSQQGLMRNPDIVSFLTTDFYLSPVSLEERNAGMAAGDTYTLVKGEGILLGDVRVIFRAFDMGQHGQDMTGQEAMTVGAIIELAHGAESETVAPVIIYGRAGGNDYRPIPSRLLGGTLQLVGMNVGMGTTPSTVTVALRHGQGTAPARESLLVEASVKPFISLIWGGTILMMVGFVLAILKRSKEA